MESRYYLLDGDGTFVCSLLIRTRKELYYIYDVIGRDMILTDGSDIQ